MNIDDLKDAWNHDEPKGMQLPISTALAGKTNSAISRIRKNMKAEFVAVLVSFVFFIALMFYGVHSGLIFNIASIFMFIIFLLNGFYFYRFFVFYKSISRYDLNLKNSISKITYELELNTEIYKTYNLCIAPVAVLICFDLLAGNRKIGLWKYILTSNILTSTWSLLIALGIILISFIITYICINLHVRLQYSRYLNELKQIMNDLGEEV